jgi:hypothetical protein
MKIKVWMIIVGLIVITALLITLVGNIVGKNLPHQTKKETVLCNPTKFLQECDMLIEEFFDLNEVASSTSRIALSPVVSEMQDVKRRFKYLEEPAFCDYTNEYKEAVVEGMDYNIQAYLDFMTDKEYLVSLDMKLALNRFEEAKEYRQKLTS